MIVGGMAEWFKAAVLKTAVLERDRGFESLSLRQEPNKNSIWVITEGFRLFQSSAGCPVFSSS
jgi:hypothetical protein